MTQIEVHHDAELSSVAIYCKRLNSDVLSRRLKMDSDDDDVTFGGVSTSYICRRRRRHHHQKYQ